MSTYQQQPVAYQPTAVYPGQVQPYAPESGPIVYVTGANGQLVPVRADLLPGQPVQHLPPPARGPVVDRRAQQMAGAGILALGMGVGGSMLFSALAAATTALGLLTASLAIVWLMRGSSSGGGKVSVNVRVDQRNTMRGHK